MLEGPSGRWSVRDDVTRVGVQSQTEENDDNLTLQKLADAREQVKNELRAEDAGTVQHTTLLFEQEQINKEISYLSSELD